MSNYEYSWHLMRTLSERLSSANSVTEELERWCCERGIGRGRFVATCARGAKAKFLDAESLKALQADAHAEPEFRRVQLAIDDVVVVDALNWYFPANLTPEICEVLRNSSVPFGRAIRTLRPKRRTFFVRQSTAEQIAGSRDQTDTAFEHHAIVLRGNGVPVAVVHERFRMVLIKCDAFSARPVRRPYPKPFPHEVKTMTRLVKQ
jgi:chorismate-pyruvate lyase